ncbi:helix-turn-helix transcriptional regulator [Paraglaciecola aquimarina]|uniref:Helix-turn-helix transcriptional regulator n=1 Tax=Paraglaciecola algarum TaxID=3050085 RepID=A0ABS9DA01_9ALTE|nr:helix-turn-helix transcriptional regulator [Paraglaciecola sp. G1-23]MCF2949564.1 helix-turn-helix transcriptional regulator [Paraglaciecola sp. G1-23]
MLQFYKKAFVIFISLLLVTAVIGYIATNTTFLNSKLIPIENSEFSWHAQTATDAVDGGKSSVSIIDSLFSLNFNMNLSSSVKYPVAMTELVFADTSGKQSFVDLSRFTSITFRAKCAPSNVITFALYTVDESITTFDDNRSYRISTSYFSCERNWQEFEIDLTRLETPEWWYKWYNHELSKQEYKLNKTVRLSFGSSIQSPLEQLSNIHVSELELHGRDWMFLYLFIAFITLTWIACIIWVHKEYTKALLADLKQKLQKDRPLVAYQQLSIEPQKNKEASTILRYMATEYANADLQLDTMVQNTGINRNKINELLKSELGYTFSAYLNKLRLTEAARLLSSQNMANVSEIAYSVGYKNVPYFNKLFKLEYGCSPKKFKDTYLEGNGEE